MLEINLGPQIREFLTTVKEDIIKQIDAQKRNATGDLKRSLRVVSNQYLKGELRSNRYIQNLQTGVGSKPKGLPFKEIKDWIKAKGIKPRRKGKFIPATETNINRTAFVIARSIKEKGTAIKRGQKGLSIDQLIKENMPETLKDMGTKMIKDFDKDFKLRVK